jgi:hypothetical protein
VEYSKTIYKVESNVKIQSLGHKAASSGVGRGGQRSFKMERRSRSCSMLKIGAALPLPLHIFKRSGAPAPAPAEWSAAPLPLLLKKNHICCKN